MKRRRVPNTVSKRFRRKLRRAQDPYLLWLRCKRPRVYARLTRWWNHQWLNRIVSIDPIDTPFFSRAPRVTSQHILHTWVCDKLVPVYPQVEMFIDKEMFPDA